MSPKGTNAGKSDDGKCERIASYYNSDDDDDHDQFEDSFATHPEEEEECKETTTTTTEQSKYIPDECNSPASASAIVPSVQLSLALPPFVRSGLQRKASLKDLKNWIALSLTLDGRDKLTKVLQYISRFLGWWFLSRGAAAARRKGNASLGHGKRFTSLYKSLGKSRKAFRLGRSLNELHKISSMGLLGLFCWHWKQQYLEDSRKIGQGGKATNETINNSHTEEPSQVSKQSPGDGLVASFTYRILPPLWSSFLGAAFPSNEESRVGWWKAIASSLKTVGMLGYWLGDNANFLASSGALDHYGVADHDRLARRKRWQEITSKSANRFYFFATLIGLATNTYAYYRFRRKLLLLLLLRGNNSNERNHPETIRDGSRSENINKEQQLVLTNTSQKEKQETEEKQFVLFLALLKSCMDVIVFSNNPGIDLYKKWRGRKNHETIHCLCGLISAGAGLYNNFPDAKTTP